MTKPSIAELLNASGHTTYTSALVTRAMYALYGNVGANLDGRDWVAIMQGKDPLALAEAGLLHMYQDRAYLVNNTQHLEQSGYVAAQAEITYRQMGERLGFTHNTGWSVGTSYAYLGQLSTGQLIDLVPVAPPPPPPPPPAPVVTYSAAKVSEAAANDGSITQKLTITLANDTFTGSDGAVLAGAEVTNVPTGLTAVVTKQSATTAELSFTGSATAHANANDITGLTVALGDAAFTSGDASKVTGATTANIGLDFIEQDTSIVVFDLVQGLSSGHSGRAFDAAKQYTIYIRVMDASAVLTPLVDRWANASAIGADDRIVLVGDGSGSGVVGWYGGLARSNFPLAAMTAWATGVGSAGRLNMVGNFRRTTKAGPSYDDLWDGAWAANPNTGDAWSAVYQPVIPTGVLTSQGLV